MGTFIDTMVMIGFFTLRLVVPLLLVVGVGYLLRRLDRKWEAELWAQADAEKRLLARFAIAEKIRNEFVLTALLGLALLALIVLGAEGRPAPPALALLRLLLGLAYVLFVPGYALQAALFPRAGDLDGPERLALSFGLSVAVVPLLALVLDRLPWGIRLWPIVAGEGLIIALWAAVAVFRRRRLAEDERPVLVLHVDARGWWAGQDRTGRVLYGVLAGALLLASVSAAAIILSPRPGELFTEFYVLGPEGLAEAYPRQARPGEPLAVAGDDDVHCRVAFHAPRRVADRYKFGLSMTRRHEEHQAFCLAAGKAFELIANVLNVPPVPFHVG